jgi:hypothetical protein
MFKNVRDDFLWDFRRSFSTLFLNATEYGSMYPSHITRFFQLIETYRTFVTALSNHGKIMKIFLEVLIFRERKDDRDLGAVLVNYILFNSSYENPRVYVVFT